MKTERISLVEWVSNDLDIDIDWPTVHNKLGLDQVNWLLNQPKEKCQLVLDRQTINNTLVAEFYDDTTLVAYHLMWSKS